MPFALLLSTVATSTFPPFDPEAGLQPGCKAVLPKCRAALKHLDAMMFREDPDEQQ